MPIKLENWCLIYGNVTPFTAPELLIPHLHGTVYQHPLHKDGTVITTSSIFAVKDGFVITRSGSAYELGEPSPEYEKEFPNCKKTLLEPKEGV